MTKFRYFPVHLYLELASVFFLVLPIFVFIFGWLNWVFLTLFFTLLLIGIVVYAKSAFTISLTREDSFQKNNWKASLFFAAIAFIWVWLSGSGGTRFQNEGLSVNCALLSNLIVSPWPMPVNIIGKENFSLVGNYAFLLPPALVGKMAGWKAANIALFLWTFFGVWISLYWFHLLVKSSRYWPALLFPFLSGMDSLGLIIHKGYIPNGIYFFDSWSILWQYLSNTTLLFWAPQEALPGWIVCGLLTSQAANQKILNNPLFIISLLFFWSPFAAVGFFPLFLFYSIDPFRKILNRKAPAIFAFIFLFMSFGFYGSVATQLNLKFITQFTDIYWEWLELALFYLVEYGLIGFLISKWFLDGELNGVSKVILGTLMCLPLINVGGNINIIKYGSIPCLFLFWVEIAKNFENYNHNATSHRILVLFIILGAFTPLAEISRSLSSYKVRPLPLSESFQLTPSLLTMERYFGRQDSIFFRFFAKKIDTQINSHLIHDVSSNQNIACVIEAEDYENPTRKNHVQEVPFASQNKIVDEGFGRSLQDYLTYSFNLREPLINGTLVAICATENDGAGLNVTIDGNPVGDLYCPNTGSWFTFAKLILLIDFLEKGPHTLRVQSHGVNINIDAFIFRINSGTSIIEAEQKLNSIPPSCIKKIPNAQGGKIVSFSNSDPNKKLDYMFNIPTSGKYRIHLVYSTESEGASCDINIDEEMVGQIKFRDTDSRLLFTSAEIPLGELEQGMHKLSIIVKGIGVYLDYLVIDSDR